MKNANENHTPHAVYPILITHFDLKKFEESLSLSEEETKIYNKEIEDIIEKYLTVLKCLPNQTEQELIKGLDKSQTHLKALIQLFSKNCFTEIYSANIKQYFNKIDIDALDTENFLYLLKSFEFANKSILKAAKKLTRGAPKNSFLSVGRYQEEFIYSLSLVYKKIYQKEPTISDGFTKKESKFFMFCEYVISFMKQNCNKEYKNLKHLNISIKSNWKKIKNKKFNA